MKLFWSKIATVTPVYGFCAAAWMLQLMPPMVISAVSGEQARKPAKGPPRGGARLGLLVPNSARTAKAVGLVKKVGLPARAGFSASSVSKLPG